MWLFWVAFRVVDYHTTESWGCVSCNMKKVSYI